jgi:hypothetical protein|tara:strand:+ start:2555 stop:2728 length:174 start_codon:yes stop_codon:yes gene_type:complete
MKMKKKIKYNKILDKNKKVDKEQLAECRKIIKELRNSGIKSSEYNLSSPFTRTNIKL